MLLMPRGEVQSRGGAAGWAPAWGERGLLVGCARMKGKERGSAGCKGEGLCRGQVLSKGGAARGVGMGLLLDGGAQPGGGDPGLEIGDAPTGKMERGVRLQVVGIEEILRGLGWD